MADETLSIKIKLDADQAISGSKQLNNSLGATNNATNELGKGFNELQKSVSSMRSYTRLTLFSNLGKDIKAALQPVGKLKEQIKDMKEWLVDFDAVTDSIHVAAQQMGDLANKTPTKNRYAFVDENGNVRMITASLKESLAVRQ